MEGQEFYPKLRQVDAFPAEVSGEKVICLRDPLNLANKILFVPYSAFFILSLFDGRHTVADIQVEFTRRFGEILYREKVWEFIRQLDENYLLETERFHRAQGEVIASFRENPVRPMTLAGQAYEADPEKLRRQIEACFALPEGPGMARPSGNSSPPVAGIIAPHIDFRRGGACYAWAHKAIHDSSPPDLFIILGTAHASTRQPFVLTRKDFQTPWGTVETDRSFLADVQSREGEDFYADEFVHKDEHSIELQLCFLRALWDPAKPLRIVPILCGSFHEAIARGITPRDLPGVRPFLDSLKEAMGRRSQRICLLASADLAHVGIRFGDREAPNRFSLETLGEEDRSLLGHAERIDAEGFYQVLLRERDRRRICGLAPIYLLLHLVSARQGRLLYYGQSMDEATQSAVTFASMAFYS